MNKPSFWITRPVNGPDKEYLCTDEYTCRVGPNTLKNHLMKFDIYCNISPIHIHFVSGVVFEWNTLQEAKQRAIYHLKKMP
jgi:hypothetical protein